MKRMAVAAAVATALTACGGGGSAERVVSSATTTIEVTTTVAATTTTVPATTTTAPPAEMPDVVDETLTAATEALRALGVEDVRVTEVEHISRPGTVLDQVPSPGRTITGPVDLTVAKALAPMPDWAGKFLAEARKYFQDRGVDVTVEEVLDDTLAEGSIVSTTPGSGQSVSSEVKLIVAKRPVTQHLAEMDLVDSSSECIDRGDAYDVGDIAINGATQQRSVWAYASDFYKDQVCSYDYNLGRDWSRLKGSVGIWDESVATMQCRFEVFVDEVPVFNQVAGLGTLIPFDLDVTNGLRLRLLITPLVANENGACVWASARLIGSGT